MMPRNPRRHGHSRSLEYRAWQQMRLRCIDPSHKAYPNYGGRGITVCDRWLESVDAFIRDMGRKPSPKHELDRKNNDGNYEPGNCRWATRSENDRNRRNNRLLEFRGETVTLAEWCERLRLSNDTVSKRLKAGWSVDRALSAPVRQKSPNGAPRCLTHPCIDCGLRETGGQRCRPCENRRRPAVVAANFSHEQSMREVA